MPHLRIETNICKSKIPIDFPKKLVETFAKSLGKPAEICVGTIVPDVNLSWGGTDQPAAQATLMCISGLGVEENKKHSKAIGELVQKELGIPKDKMYIFYIPVPAPNVGYDGTTYADIAI